MTKGIKRYLSCGFGIYYFYIVPEKLRFGYDFACIHRKFAS